MAQLRGFLRKITGDHSYDALNKPLIVDAETKLNVFKEAIAISVGGLEAYLKYMSKSMDKHLSDKFAECNELFNKYESRGDMINPSVSHVLGAVFSKLNELQAEMHAEVAGLTRDIEANVLKPLSDYQKEIVSVKENRKELKEAYDKIDTCRKSLENARRDVETAQKAASGSSAGHPSHRLNMIGTSSESVNRRLNDQISKLEEKVQRAERELDDVQSLANERYDKYTEGLYKRIADECELTNSYLEYLMAQRRYHKQALRRLDTLIPEVKDSLQAYSKKPVFGCSLTEYVQMSGNASSNNRGSSTELMYVSPVIRKLIDGMWRQSAFVEEGIFRVAGSRVKMNCLLYAINAGYLEHIDVVNDFDVHCLASVLKQYIRELPDSILCNELYESWLVAINTSPLANKIEAFKSVLQKLPRANYENLRYLIKFLSIIVENSDKTKMTASNMGICFGVSLLSTSAAGGNGGASGANLMAVNAPTSAQAINGETGGVVVSARGIDMSTATNVFDFLLSNHDELLPGDIRFGSTISNNAQQLTPISNNNNNNNYVTAGSQLRSNTSFYRAHNTSNQSLNKIKSTPTTLATDSQSNNSNNYNAYLLNDSSLNENTPSVSAAASLFIHTKANSGGGSAAAGGGGASMVPSPAPSPIGATTASVSNHRHTKNNSMDTKFNYVSAENYVERELTAASPLSSSNSSMSKSNPNSELGSMSPKSTQRKKQAPAPPPGFVPSPIVSTSSTLPSDNVNVTPRSHQPFPSVNVNEGSESFASATFINSIARLHPNNPTGDFSSSPSSNGLSSHPIEKPTHPPPIIPNRPPPIGFNLNSALISETTATAAATLPQQQQQQIDIVNSRTSDLTLAPYPPNDTHTPLYPRLSSPQQADPMQSNDNVDISNSNLSNTSTSSISSYHDASGTKHPPKPIVPRKPGSIVNRLKSLSSHFGSSNEPAAEECIADASLKSTNEITSL